MTTKNRRININPSVRHHDYLERQSKETGMPKTALVQMAIENMIKQEEQLVALQKLTQEAELQRIQEQLRQDS